MSALKIVAGVWLMLTPGQALVCRAAEPLAIVNPGIRQMEDGAPLPPGFTFVPGEVLFFSFQVAGFKPADDKVHLSYQVDAFDPDGVRIVEPIKGAVDTELAPQDKNWKPKVHHEIPLPPLAGSGTFKLVAHVADEVGKTEASKEVPFEVRGRAVAPSPTLVIRNFHFYRSEEDTQPLAQAVYRPGDQVWAKFDIIGYKFGEGNLVEVRYGIAVLNSAGNVLFSQDQAAEEHESSFYPKRYVPGSMSLNLQPKIRPGDYFLVVKVADAIGKQNFESKEKFSVE